MRIIVTFPVPVEQISPREVEIPLPETSLPAFTAEYCAHVRETMGSVNGDRFLADMVIEITRNWVIQNIK